MRRVATLLVLLMTCSGCMSPRAFRATVRSGVRDVVAAGVLVVAVATLIDHAVRKSRERRRHDERRECSVEERWAHARGGRR